MPKTRGLQRATDKWEQRVAVAGADYEAGVRAPRTDWQAATKEAAGRHKEATIKALNEGRFEKGVGATPTADWQRATIEKGAKRWPDGVAAGKTDFSAGMQPIIQAIEATNLPPRFPAGDPRNLARVAAINKAVSDAAKK